MVAAAELRTFRPDLADLEPQLLARLSPQFDAAVYDSAGTAKPLPRGLTEMHHEVKQVEVTDLANFRDTRNAYRILLVGVALCALLFLAIARGRPERDSSRIPATQSYFTVAEVESFRDFQKDPGRGPSRPRGTTSG